jgi:hypothetical protein
LEDEDQKPPRTGIDKFLWGSGVPGEGAGAIWWGSGALIQAVATIALLLYGVWWAIIFIPFIALQFWMMRKSIRERNF